MEQPSQKPFVWSWINVVEEKRKFWREASFCEPLFFNDRQSKGPFTAVRTSELDLI